jgi:hypothetical protein
MNIQNNWLKYVVLVLVIVILLAGCVINETLDARLKTPPSVFPLPTIPPAILPNVLPVIQATPTHFVLGPLFDPNIDLKAGPIDLPLVIQIPSLNVKAPVLGVGLTSDNNMDSPKGPLDDPIWHKAFWYRGSSIPGEPGTATITGHVNDSRSRPEIFANLQDLQPGDLVIVHYSTANIVIIFIVDEIMVYSTQESSDPLILSRIFGTEPIFGTDSKPSYDDTSHLTLITCAGNMVNGEFDHHTVVYTTLQSDSNFND